MQNYLQCTMMSRCSNSANEKSTMEHLFLQLSRKAEPTLLMLTSSKYHCEVAGGESSSFGGYSNKDSGVFHQKNNTKQKFNKFVREDIESCINKENVIRLSGLCCCYMMAYQKHVNSNDKTLTFNGIERYTKQMKTHSNVSDIEKGLIEREYAGMGLH